MILILVILIVKFAVLIFTCFITLTGPLKIPLFLNQISKFGNFTLFSVIFNLGYKTLISKKNFSYLWGI